MNNIKKQLLLVFLTFNFTFIYGQSPLKLNKPYVSGYVGGLLAGEEISAALNFGAGYQFNKWLGTGLSLGFHSNGTCLWAKFTGMGLDYRLIFPDKWVLNFTGGLGLKSAVSCDIYKGELRNPKVNFPYFKFHAGRKLGKIFTVGAAIWIAKTKFEYWVGEEDVNGQLIFSYKNRRAIDLSGFVFTIGANIN